MTILALTGLHGSGKSHLSKLVSMRFGWRVLVKRDLLRQIHAQIGFTEQWEDWYRRQYATVGAINLTAQFVDLLPHGDVILDAVHNLDEWRIIKSLRPSSVLAAVIAPASVRAMRNHGEDPTLDVRRVGYWHATEQEPGCLMSECDWCFNGAADPETSIAEFSSFLSWLKA